MEPAIAAERMRHRDEATLIVDPRDRLLRAEVARDRLFQEQTDDLAIAAADLFADDHAEAVGELAQTQRALDRVVVGRAHDVQPSRLDRRRPRAAPSSWRSVASSRRPANVMFPIGRSELSRAIDSRAARSRPSPTTTRRMPSRANARTAMSARL